MTHKFSIIAAILLTMLAINVSAQSRYSIKGSVKGITSGQVKLVTNLHDDSKDRAVDSAVIVKGAFSLNGKIGIPQMMSLVFEPGNWSFPVFIEDTSIVISADTTGASHYDRTQYGMGRGATISRFAETGSKNYDDWMAYQNDPGQRQYDALFDELQKKSATVGNYLDRQKTIRNQMDSVRSLLTEWQKKRIEQYVTQYPYSVAGVYMYDQLYHFSFATGKMSYREVSDMLNKFTGEAKASFYYLSLMRSMMQLRSVQIGSVAPDFTLLKRDSSKFTLSSSHGKYLLIDFWASWCHPCREAIPHWKSVYQLYHDKGFDIVSVSADSKWNEWIKAMDVEKMPWTQVDDKYLKKNMPGEVQSLYMTTFIPFYVLVDKEGRILLYTGDENKIDETLKKIFK